MIILFFLLCFYALLGSADVIYFHIYKFKIYKRTTSRLEHLTHLVRTFLFFCIILWILFAQPKGAYAIMLPALLILDFINSLIDVYLEPQSRSSLGGLPPFEYLVHMLSMFISGAILIVALIESGKVIHQGATLSFHILDMPRQFIIQGFVTAGITLFLLLFEGFYFIKYLLAKKETA